MDAHPIRQPLTFEHPFDYGERPINRTPVRVPEQDAGEEHLMALVHMSPVEAEVRWDRAADRPAEIRWAGHQRRVTELDAVRDERAAYPAARGPRVTLVLRTDDGGRAAVVFDGRRRRWFVEAIEAAA
jgi:hypothetical protein